MMITRPHGESKLTRPRRREARNDLHPEREKRRTVTKRTLLRNDAMACENTEQETRKLEARRRCIDSKSSMTKETEEPYAPLYLLDPCDIEVVSF